MNTWYRNTEDTEKEYHKGSILSAEHAPYTYYVLDKDEISQYLPSDNISTDITTVYIMTTYILDWNTTCKVLLDDGYTYYISSIYTKNMDNNNFWSIPGYTKYYLTCKRI